MARRGGLSYKQTRTKAQREADKARRSELRRLLPGPATKRARALIGRLELPDTEEIRFLRRAALDVTLNPKHNPLKDANPYADELRAMATRIYRGNYNAQQKARGKGRAASAAKRAAEWIKVKAHRRRRPGGGS